MLEAHTIHEDVQFASCISVAQVKRKCHCFSSVQAPQLPVFWKVCKVRCQFALSLGKSFSLFGTTDIICIDEPATTGSRQVICVQIKQSWRQDWAWGKPLACLRQELISSPMWTRKRRFLKSSSTVWTSQKGRHFDSLEKRPVCQMVSYAVVKSRKTAPVFSCFSKPFSMNVVSAVTWLYWLRLV